MNKFISIFYTKIAFESKHYITHFIPGPSMLSTWCTYILFTFIFLRSFNVLFISANRRYRSSVYNIHVSCYYFYVCKSCQFNMVYLIYSSAKLIDTQLIFFNLHVYEPRGIFKATIRVTRSIHKSQSTYSTTYLKSTTYYVD